MEEIKNKNVSTGETKEKDLVDMSQVKHFYEYLNMETTNVPGKENIIKMFKKLKKSTSFARKVHKEMKSWEHI